MRNYYAHRLSSIPTQEHVVKTEGAIKATRKPTNLSLDSTLLKEAKALGINVSRSAEAGIEEAVRRSKREQWLKANADALNSSNAFVEANGLPLAKYRRF